MNRIIYFDNNTRFRETFIEFMSSENSLLNINLVVDEDDLYKAAKENKTDVLLIDLYSLGNNVIPKIKKLISFSENKTTIIILSSSGRIIDKYFRNTGEAMWFDKNEELEEVIEAIKLIPANNDFRILK